MTRRQLQFAIGLTALGYSASPSLSNFCAHSYFIDRLRIIRYKRCMIHNSSKYRRGLKAGPCTVENCCNKAHAKSLCKRHYHKLVRYGDPMGGWAIAKGDAEKWIINFAIKYDGNDCLDWPFGKCGRGYGRHHVDGKPVPASRYICQLRHGPPSHVGLDAAHSCGNGHLGCVNPKHLRWATKKENASDKVLHGTKIEGELHAAAKLTRDDIIAIRSSNLTQWELAHKYGVHQATINRIKLRKSWEHVS